MNAVESLRDAVHSELQHLMAQVAARDTLNHPIPPRFSRDQVERLLRIEVSHDGLRDLYRCRDSYNYMPPPVSDFVPLKFMGIALYVVRHALPACGWKVINPLRKPA